MPQLRKSASGCGRDRKDKRPARHASPRADLLSVRLRPAGRAHRPAPDRRLAAPGRAQPPRASRRVPLAPAADGSRTGAPGLPHAPSPDTTPAINTWCGSASSPRPPATAQAPCPSLLTRPFSAGSARMTSPALASEQVAPHGMAATRDDLGTNSMLADQGRHPSPATSGSPGCGPDHPMVHR